MQTTITPDGELPIPPELIREMNLAPGQRVGWEKLSASECRLVFALKPDPLAALGFAARHGLPAGSTEEWMKLLREGEQPE